MKPTIETCLRVYACITGDRRLILIKDNNAWTLPHVSGDQASPRQTLEGMLGRIFSPIKVSFDKSAIILKDFAFRDHRLDCIIETCVVKGKLKKDADRMAIIMEKNSLPSHLIEIDMRTLLSLPQLQCRLK